MDISTNTTESVSPNETSPLKLIERLGPERAHDIWWNELPRAYRFWINYGMGAQNTAKDIESVNEEVTLRLGLAHDYSHGSSAMTAARNSSLGISKDTVFQIIHRVEKLTRMVLSEDEQQVLGITPKVDPELERVKSIYDAYTNLPETLEYMVFEDFRFDTLLDRNPHFQILSHFLKEGYNLVQTLNYFGISAFEHSSVKNYNMGIRRAVVGGEVSDDMKVGYMRHFVFGHFLKTGLDCRGTDPGYRIAETTLRAGEGHFVSSRREGAAMRELAIFARLLPTIHYSYLQRSDNGVLRNTSYLEGIFPGAKVNGRFDVSTVDPGLYTSGFIENRAARYGLVPEPFYFIARDVISGKTLDSMAYDIKASGVPYAVHTIHAALCRGIIFLENMLLAKPSFLDLSMEEQKQLIRRDGTKEIKLILEKIAEKVVNSNIPSSSSPPSRKSL